MYLECSFLCQVPRLDFRRSHIETSEAQDHRQTQLITMHCNALQCTALAAPFDKYGTDWYWKFPEVAGYAKPGLCEFLCWQTPSFVRGNLG